MMNALKWNEREIFLFLIFLREKKNDGKINFKTADGEANGQILWDKDASESFFWCRNVCLTLWTLVLDAIMLRTFEADDNTRNGDKEVKWKFWLIQIVQYFFYLAKKKQQENEKKNIKKSLKLKLIGESFSRALRNTLRMWDEHSWTKSNEPVSQWMR